MSVKDNIMKKNEFKCCSCGEIFKKGWSDEEAIKELNNTFYSIFDEEDCDVVCDDCYKKIMEKK